jgi:aspartyl-tRNA(Asn)/glutamyl-tRNA(Gln) amidotransferase subunit B
MMERARAALPELPAARIARYEADYGLSYDAARTLAWRPERAGFFEQAAAASSSEPARVANWLEQVREEVALEPGALAALVDLVTARTISNDAGRKVLEILVREGGSPAEIVEREGLAAMGDSDELSAIVEKAIADNPDVAERIRGGNDKAIGALMGPVMRETKGRADGGEVQRIIREKLGV